MMHDLRNLHDFGKPELVMVIEPETKVRFRYKSEGGSHGGITGKQKANGRKTYPTVKLENYHGNKPVFVRVSLYTEDRKEHVLEFKGNRSKEEVKYIEEYLQDDFSAKFTNLKILSKKKDEIEKLLMDRKLQTFGDNISKCVRTHFEKDNEDIKKRAREILNSVRLYFEAFEKDNPKALCSLFSDIISNQKAAAKGDLKIHRMSRIDGSWKGGEDVILLCDKIQKDNIKIRFYEIDDSDNIVWQQYGKFSSADVHYQVAITFKTPAYKENVEKTVFVCLERQDEVSEAREFTYKSEAIPSKKRKYMAGQSTSRSDSDSSMSISSPGSCSNETSVSMSAVSEPQPTANDLMHMIGESGADSNLIFTMEEIEKTFEDFPLLFPDVDIPDFPENMNEEVEVVQPQCLFTLEFGKDIEIDGQMSALSLMESDETESENESEEDIRKVSKNINYSKTYLQEKKQLCSSLLLKRDNFGNTVLHVAVQENNKHVSSILKMNVIANSGIINVQNCRKETALHIAVEKRKVDLVKILLQNDANPNLKNSEGENCFHIAAKKNYRDVIVCLLKYSKIFCNVNAFDYDGLTPLHVAVKNNSEDCFHLLHKTNPDDRCLNLVDKKNSRSLLHFAVEFQPTFISLLLNENETDVNIQDCEGNTPLHLACSTENVNAVKQLLKAGAFPLLKNYKQNSNMLIEEISEDISEGQIPADMTTNREILELLRTAEEQLNQQSSNTVSETSETNHSLEKLCNHLDKERRWKKIACYFIEEKFVESLDCSASPTKTLLELIKKENQDSYIENFKAVLKMAELHDAVKIIEGF